MRYTLTLLIIGLLATDACFAHSDRILPIGEDGAIDSLPPEFGPGALRVDFSQKPDDAAVTSITLELGRTRTILPMCVTGLLLTRSLDDVEASGSWYHKETVLPYYIAVKFFDPGYNDSNWANSGYSFLFNLRTGKLIRMEVLIVRDNGRSFQTIPVDLGARCTPAELSGFKDDTSR